MEAEQGYLLGNGAPQAVRRLEAIAELFDAVTFRHLENVGIHPGWHCWEVGGGGPSVPNWLAERVGPSGRVLVTDIDVSALAGYADPTVEVRRHDVGADTPPDGRFDLVHARLVLVHVPAREAALRAMVGALRPGGWLVIEDADPTLQPLACPDEISAEERLANRLRTGFRTLLAGRGGDLAFGRTLPRLLRESGLADVGADVFFPLASPAAAPLEVATIDLVGAGLVAAGLAAEEEIEEHLSAVRSGRLDLTTAPLVSAWGRRP